MKVLFYKQLVSFSHGLGQCHTASFTSLSFMFSSDKKFKCQTLIVRVMIGNLARVN